MWKKNHKCEEEYRPLAKSGQIIGGKMEKDRIEKLIEDFERLIDYANMGVDFLANKANISNIREDGEFLDLYQCICGILDSLDGLEWQIDKQNKH